MNDERNVVSRLILWGRCWDRGGRWRRKEQTKKKKKTQKRSEKKKAVTFVP